MNKKKARSRSWWLVIWPDRLKKRIILVMGFVRGLVFWCLAGNEDRIKMLADVCIHPHIVLQKEFEHVVNLKSK